MKRILSTLAILIALVSATTAQNKLDSTAFRAMQVGRVMQQERVFLQERIPAYTAGRDEIIRAVLNLAK